MDQPTTPTPRRARPGAAPARLTRAAIEIEQHVAAGGWDQPPRLFALVPTADLVAAQPHLAGALGGDGPPGQLTPVEQDDLPPHASLEELLAGILWPPGVAGTAIVIERLMLPATAEREVFDEVDRADHDAVRAAAEHPLREEVRLAVAVLRDGSRECAVRMRSADRDRDVLSGPDLVPALADALALTLRA